MDKKKIRCAIYTRKSSEEGLEQDFNSLDAQREACEAYIKSQMHEGWTLITKVYNDGGYSGGTMNRPAFQELLMDIEKDKIDFPQPLGECIWVNELSMRICEEIGAEFPMCLQGFQLFPTAVAHKDPPDIR